MNKKNTLTKEDRKWRVIGVLGNILMFIITGATVTALLFIADKAMRDTTSSAYKFMHQSRLTGIALAFLVVVFALVVLTLSARMFLTYAWRLLKSTVHSLIKFLEREIQKESDRIQDTLRRKHVKAILAVDNGIDQKIERGQRINKKKAKRGEPVSLRYI